MVDGFITWMIGILVLIAVLLLCYAGFKLVTSAGNSSAVTEAKGMLVNVIVGFVIILAAWTIVDTLIKALAGGDLGVWNPISCGTLVPPSTEKETYKGGDVNSVAVVSPSWEYGYDAGDDYTVGEGLPGGVYPQPGSFGDITGCSGGDCVRLSAPCKNSASCSVAPGLVSAINQFHIDAAVSGARVTEAMPRTREHKSQCHYNGTCVDYSKSGGMTADEVKRVIAAARKNGLRPVYEVKYQSDEDTLVRQGVKAEDVIVLGSHISAEHFSIYAQ